MWVMARKKTIITNGITTYLLKEYYEFNQHNSSLLKEWYIYCNETWLEFYESEEEARYAFQDLYNKLISGNSEICILDREEVRERLKKIK